MHTGLTNIIILNKELDSNMAELHRAIENLLGKVGILDI